MIYQDTIPMSIVNNRINGLNGAYGAKRKVNGILMLESLQKNGFTFDKVLNIAYNWDTLASDKDLAVSRVFDLLEETAIYGTEGNIESLTNIIISNILPSSDPRQVREAANMLTKTADNIKSKMKENSRDIRLAAKRLTKGIKNNIKNNVEDIENNAKNAFKLKADGKPDQQSSKPDKDKKDTEEDKKEEKLEECLSRIITASNDYINCDRLLENYKTFSKRFNILDMVNSKNSIEESVQSFCNMLDTYNTPFKTKYNAALETMLYLYYRNVSSPYDESDIVTEVTDYYLNGKDYDVDTMIHILTNNRFISEDAANKSMNVLMSDRKIAKYRLFNIPKTMVNDYRKNIMKMAKANNISDKFVVDKRHAKIFGSCYLMSFKSTSGLAPDIKETFKAGSFNGSWAARYLNYKIKVISAVSNNAEGYNIFILVPKNRISVVVTKEETLEELLEANAEPFEVSKLRKELGRAKIDKEKNPSLLRRVIRAATTDSPRNIVDGTPSLLKFIRIAFIASTFAINPIIGCIGTLSGYLAGTHFEKKELERLIAAYEKEKEAATKAMSKCDDERKERYEKYIAELDKTIKALKDHKDNKTMTEKELEERDNASDDFDDDFSFDEQMERTGIELGKEVIHNVAVIQTIANQVDKLTELYNNNRLLNLIRTNFRYISDENLINLAEFANLFPSYLDPAEYKKVLEENRRALIESGAYTNVSNVKNYVRADAINEAFFKIKDIEKELYEKYVINEYTNIDDCIACIEAANLTVRPMLEMSITNTFKLGIEKLKKGAQNLSTKEKELSKTIDAYSGSMMRAAENALKNDNREAIIRGSLIPSFSKIIKGCVVAGITYIIAGPVIAAIGVIAAIACSKKIQKKERQLILDEIEVEMKYTDRQIRLAEDNNDMKSLKQLYRIEKDLKRQHQRILYNANVVHNEKLSRSNKYDDVNPSDD